jgi:hypothetical protein
MQERVSGRARNALLILGILIVVASTLYAPLRARAAANDFIPVMQAAIQAGMPQALAQTLNWASPKTADLACMPYVVQNCYCGTEMGKNGCQNSANRYLCPCADPRGVTGLCMATGECRAMSFTGLGGQQQGLGGQVGGIVGQLMSGILQKLMGGGSGSGSGTGATGGTGTTSQCPSGYYKTSSITSDPCAIYDPQLGATPGTADTTGTECSLSQILAGTCGTLGTSGTNLTTGIDRPQQNVFSAHPLAGAAPLIVTFTSNVTGQGSKSTIDFGDGASEEVDYCYAPTDACLTPGTNTHTYVTPGTYTAKLLGVGSSTVTSVTIAVGGEDTSTTATSSTSGLTVTSVVPDAGNEGGETSAVATGRIGAFISNTTAQGIVQGIIQGAAPDSTRGDIQVFETGATIVGGNRAGNSDVVGFYGADATNSTGLVGGLCQSRPWASNFLSHIIPPTFFDGLCSWRGYDVGASQPVVTVPQRTQPQQTTPSTAAATTTTTIQPEVRIWAVPEAVRLGGRTYIYWDTKGVTDCLVTSPDGSFRHTTVEGAASTVPITTATTFSISCKASDGTPVTNYVTVKIAI